MSTGILVLGIHRSGTSMVAGVLHHLGVDMGTPDPCHISPSNPKGQFEDAIFVDLCSHILGDWQNPVPLLFKTARLQRLIDHIYQRSITSHLWGIKTPQLVHLMQIILHNTPINWKIITTERNIEDSIESLAKRDDLPPLVAQHIICGDYAAMLTARNCSEDLKIPRLIVPYTKHIDPLLLVQEIANFIGVDTTDEAAGFVDMELNHGAC